VPENTPYFDSITSARARLIDEEESPARLNPDFCGITGRFDSGDRLQLDSWSSGDFLQNHTKSDC